MDERIIEWKEILINAGQRGAMLKMWPLDICEVLECMLVAVSTRRDEKD